MRKIMAIRISFFLYLLVVTQSACGDADMKDYRRLVSKEMATGKRVDSLFFGIHFGMTSKEFYAHCWELNKKGLLTDGLNNMAVLYKLNRNELRHNGSMNFYPQFYENRIVKMPVTFQYDGWAPWNKNLFADSLKEDVLHLYKKWYPGGNPFIKMEDEKRGTIYIKVDGNRRITIGRYNDLQVKVDYTDLSVKRKEK
jgi:hypothetical protein